MANKISGLADDMRYGFQSPQELTSLQKEAAMLKNYIGVFRLQYGERIGLEIHIPEESRQYKLPKMLIKKCR